MGGLLHHSLYVAIGIIAQIFLQYNVRVEYEYHQGLHFGLIFVLRLDHK